MGATLSNSPKFALPNGSAPKFNMSGAISMQCLQNHHHFGTACRCNEFGKAAMQRRQSAHSAAVDRQNAQRKESWDKADANNNSSSNNHSYGDSSNSNTSRKSVATSKSVLNVSKPSLGDSEAECLTPSDSASARLRYSYQSQLSMPQNVNDCAGATHSMYAYPAESIKPSKSMASLKDNSRSNGQSSHDVLGALPALKSKAVSPSTLGTTSGSSRSVRPAHSMSNSQSLSQLRPALMTAAAMSGINETLSLANKRVSNFFAKRSNKELSGKHGRSVTVDTASMGASGVGAGVGVSAGVGVESSNRATHENEREKENAAFENAPSHNYRQPIPKSMSCYNIKSQHHTYYAADGAGVATSASSSVETASTLPAEHKAQPRRTVLQASTTELLHYLSEYLYRQSPHLHNAFKANDAIMWIRSADKNLILQGWSDINFINPANVVFVFMLLRNVVDYREVRSVNELHAITMTCLYLAYSYMGNEISYPLKPFFLDCDDRDAFWQRCLDIINLKSAGMLRLNTDPVFFAEIFAELKGYSIKSTDATSC